MSLMVSVAVAGHVGRSSNPSRRPSITCEASDGASGNGFAISSSSAAFRTNRVHIHVCLRKWSSKWSKKGYRKGDPGQEGLGVPVEEEV